MTASTHVDAPPEQVLRRMVELACLAPSIHNTQPWIWQVSGRDACLYADHDRQLQLEDPLGRNLVISCGAALHHFQLAARALGWRAEVDRLPEPEDPALLAHIRLHREPGADAVEVLDAMRARCTDRRRFTSWPVPEERLETLCEEARNWDAVATPVLDTGTRIRLELMIRRALGLREIDPPASAEQRQWTGRTGNDGVPLQLVPDAPVGDDRLSRFGHGLLREAHDMQDAVDSNDSLIVLGGTADDPMSWLRTGEALSALWIRASRSGLSVVPLSQPIEVPETLRELKVHLHNEMEPHLLVRIGWQAIGRSELPRTPRRPVDEVLRA